MTAAAAVAAVACAALAGAIVLRSSTACSPSNTWIPVCEQLSNGSKVLLTPENAKEVLEPGIERAWVTCFQRGIDGPAILYLSDPEAFNSAFGVAGYPFTPFLPATARRLDVVGSLRWESWRWTISGPIVAYGSKNQVLLTVDVEDDEPVGPFMAWSEDGQLRTEGQYAHKDRGWGSRGRHGKWTTWDNDGRIVAVQYFCGGMPIGRHVTFDRNGAVARVDDYSDSDYSSAAFAREALPRSVVEPPELRDLQETSCGIGNPLYPLLTATVVRQTTFADGRPAEYALASSRDVFRWFSLGSADNLSKFLQPGATVTTASIAGLPTASLKVSDAFTLHPLRDDVMRDHGSSGVHWDMMSDCRPWLRESFDLP
jgi:hypothetical protein